MYEPQYTPISPTQPPRNFKDCYAEATNLQIPMDTLSPRSTSTFIPFIPIEVAMSEDEKQLLQLSKRRKLSHPRKVQFASKLEEVFYRTDSSLGNEDDDEMSTMNDRWYHRADYKAFKDDTRDTILAVYRAKGQLQLLDMNEYTVTGLEKSLSLGQVMARKRNSALHVYTVIMEQNYCSHPLHIRQVSELFTKQSIQRAYFRGVLDRGLLLIP